jgi:hypothetical protein
MKRTAQAEPAGAPGVPGAPGAPGAPGGPRPALTDGDGRSFDFPPISSTFTRAERELTEFWRLHPMLSAHVMRRTTLKAMASMIEREPIRANSLPVCDKPYEDKYLRAASGERGERSCLLGSECIVNTIAKMRSVKPFCCREFLLPEEEETWLQGGGLPTTHGKCLVCCRYWTTFVYLVARSDPDFYQSLRRMQTQRHSNALAEPGPNTPNSAGALADPTESCEAPPGPSGLNHAGHAGSAADGVAEADPAWHQRELQAKLDAPRHCNPVLSPMGYRRSAMLFVDESFIDCAAARESAVGVLNFRPFVRFDSSTLKFDLSGKLPRLLQVGVGMDDAFHLKGEPSRRTAVAAGAFQRPSAS